MGNVRKTNEARKTRKFPVISSEGKRMEFEVSVPNKGTLKKMAQGPPREGSNEMATSSAIIPKRVKITSFIQTHPAYPFWVFVILGLIVTVIVGRLIEKNNNEDHEMANTAWEKAKGSVSDPIVLGIAKGLKDQSSKNRHTALVQLRKYNKNTTGYICWSAFYDQDPYNRLTALAILLDINLSCLSDYDCFDEYMVSCNGKRCSFQHNYDEEWYKSVSLDIDNVECSWDWDKRGRCKWEKKNISDLARYGENDIFRCVGSVATNDDSPMVRKVAVVILSYTNESMFNYLEDVMLNDDDQKIRELAIKAIDKIKGKKKEEGKNKL